MSEQLLKLEHITMQFGGVVAVDDLNLEINRGEIVALIGPNGAGKTTAFNVITGVYQPTNGAVWFDGEKIIENHPQGKMKKAYKGGQADDYHSVLAPTPDKLTKAGMARTFQNIRLWKSQTVFDNVLIAKHCRAASGVFSAAFRLNRKEEAAQRAEVEELLEIVGLSDLKEEPASSLPYGKQRRLEIARALALVHDGLYERALANLQAKTYVARTYDEFLDIAANRPGFIKAMWCGDSACEDKIKDETGGVKSRCIPFVEEHLSDVCVCCGKPAKHQVYWGKQY